MHSGAFMLMVFSTFQIGYTKFGALPPISRSLEADVQRTSGGPAGLVYGYIIAWLGTLAAFTSLAELASM